MLKDKMKIKSGQPKKNKDAQNKKIGLRIQMARKEIGLNQNEFAVKLNKNRTTVANWEIGRFEPSNEILKKISDITQKPISYFFGEEQHKPTGYLSNEMKEAISLAVKEEMSKYNKK
jgi:transcriptional regulator with XRE-family HTH domain